VINALFMVVSALTGILVLGVLEVSIPGFFLLLSMLNAVVLLVVWRLRRSEMAKPVDN
jgi:membrane protein implicated in regulation of membrane protease activity